MLKFATQTERLHFAVTRQFLSFWREHNGLIAPTPIRTDYGSASQNRRIHLLRKLDEKPLRLACFSFANPLHVHAEAGREQFGQKDQRSMRNIRRFQKHADLGVVSRFVFPDNVMLAAENFHKMLFKPFTRRSSASAAVSRRNAP